MEIINISLNDIKPLVGISVCLGYFDAMHKGHLSLVEEAKKHNQKVGLMTLEPNPKSFFTNTSDECVNSFEDKCEILNSLGVDYFIILKAEKALLDLSPEEFVEKVLIPLGITNVICGFDYTFGKCAKGKLNDLILLSKNRFNVYSVDEVTNDKKIKISSTLIHSLIEEGNVEEANKYLYRPYQIKGTVIKGNQIGRKIGFKTANVVIENKYITPKKGVYAGYVIVNNNKYKAMINVGTHPTVGDSDKVIIEPHIIDFDQDIYGQDIIIIFSLYIREESKFKSVNDLVNQLNTDKRKIIDLIY